MDMATLSQFATKAAVNGSTIVGRKLLTRHQKNKIAAEAAGILVAGNTGRFIDHLSQQQLHGFQQFAESAQFDHLVRQAMISSLAATSDETRSALREQLRHGLRHHGEFDGADLLQATDVLEGLVYAAVHAVRQTASSGTLDSGRAVAMAARVAAAGVRNSELLGRIQSLNEINQFAREVRSAAKACHAKLTVATHDKGLQVDYAQLYVAPAFVAHNRDPFAPSPLEGLSESGRFGLADVVSDTVRFVILGDPGAGKSTLAAKLTHDLAADKIIGLEGQVPILLIVREHTQSLRADHHTLLHYLEAACRRPGNVEPPPDALEYLLLNGRATIIIDGVDELGDNSFRRSFAQLVEGFAHRYPLARVIVTSRVVGYADAPLDPALFPSIGITSFNRAQVVEYANRWFQIEASLSTTQCQQLTESFMRESEAARDLRVNPLLLSLLCRLYSTMRYIPRSKPEIYEKCAELLYETWDRRRGVEIVYRYGAHISPAVRRVAWRLFTDPQGRQTLPRTELIAFLTEYMKTKRFEDHDEAAQAAADFLDFCAGRAWVLTEVGSDALQPHYGFVHRTFLEFFAASQLVKRQPDADAVWDHLEPHLDNGTWAVVGQLAVQILDRSVDDGADQLLRLALHRVDTVPGALCFAARCLENIAPDNVTLRDVVTHVVERACALPAEWRRKLHLGPLEDVDDRPLTRLLQVTSPDNAIRIARVVADAVARCARLMPGSTSAGLLYDMLLNNRATQSDTASVIGQLVAEELSQRAVPEAAQVWHRLLHLPTADDLAEHGLQLLYEMTCICDTVARPALEWILAETMSPSVGQLVATPGGCHETLERYYPHVIADAAWLDQVSVPGEVWGEILLQFQDEDMRAMSPTARAALILLLLPVARETRAGASGIGRLVDTAEVGYLNEAAAIVNSWELPAEAHDFLVEWIHSV